MAAAVLAAGLFATSQGWGPGVVQTELFVSLILVHVAMAYPARATPSAFGAGWWRNRALLSAVAGSLLLQVLVLGVPAIRAAMHVAALPLAGWLAAACAMAGAIALVEAGRLAAGGAGARKLVQAQPGR